ncbi:MAG: hypothetical protein HC884_03865 [Chloroflexaceae bacterium]|nr:hypothetical protein [Chloroflexaceae bacterium]
MDTHPPLFALPALEAEARAIIEPRRVLIEAFARQCVGKQRADLDANALDPGALWPAFREVAPTLAPLDYLPLARQLEVRAHRSLMTHVQEAYLQRLHRTHALHPPGHNPQKKAPPLDAPAVAATLDRIRAVIAASDNLTQWASAFMSQELFHDPRTAKQAAYDLAKMPRRAAHLARSLVQRWLHTDDSALLHHATYPHATELDMLQSQAAEAARQSSGAIDLPTVLRELRADVVCLARVLQHPDLNAPDQRRVSPHHRLYDVSLWHQPPHSDYRKHAQERLPDEMCEMIVRDLMQQRGCDAATAAQIFDCYLFSTLSVLVTWRCQQHHPTLDLHLERGRIRHATEKRIAGLPPTAQQTICNRLDYLQDALSSAGVSLSLSSLVTDLPGSAN